MTQVVSVDTKIIRTILSTLDDLKREVSRLSEKLEEAPPYGSSEWWEWSNKRALKSIREGKGTVIRNKNELDKFFKNLKSL